MKMRPRGIMVGSWIALILAFATVPAFAIDETQMTHKRNGVFHFMLSGDNETNGQGYIVAGFDSRATAPGSNYLDFRAVVCLYRGNTQLSCDVGAMEAWQPVVSVTVQTWETNCGSQAVHARFEVSTWSHPQSGNIMPLHRMYLCNTTDFNA